MNEKALEAAERIRNATLNYFHASGVAGARETPPGPCGWDQEGDPPWWGGHPRAAEKAIIEEVIFTLQLINSRL